ncbi:MAG: 30S ribosomal protein S13 [Gammaproteobacteria bacterium]|jgi:small subunit ribosomal protein S13|nr:30S ribosomal protein S13 [Gammaproteobacteria bacterium]
MAVRLSGIILPPNKHIRIALRSVYGIGSHRAMAICKKVGIEPSRKVNDLKDEYTTVLQEAVNEYVVEGDLRRRVAMDIKRLKDIKCYRGRRHTLGLPVRGQRTKTNARTRKGRKRQSQMVMKPQSTEAKK